MEAHSRSGLGFVGDGGLSADTMGTALGRKIDAEGSVASKDGRDKQLRMASSIRNAELTRSPASGE